MVDFFLVRVTSFGHSGMNYKGQFYEVDGSGFIHKIIEHYWFWVCK